MASLFSGSRLVLACLPAWELRACVPLAAGMYAHLSLWLRLSVAVLQCTHPLPWLWWRWLPAMLLRGECVCVACVCMCGCACVGAWVHAVCDPVRQSHGSEQHHQRQFPAVPSTEPARERYRHPASSAPPSLAILPCRTPATRTGRRWEGWCGSAGRLSSRGLRRQPRHVRNLT
jgi:hypothetical protein